MHNATSPLSRLRLAIAAGVPWTHLSDVLALQRLEEPKVKLDFFEVAGDDLVRGLLDGQYDVGLALRGHGDPSLKGQSMWVQPLWAERLVVATPPQSPLLDRTELLLTDLLDYPLYRWPAEVCLLLDRRLSFLPPVDQKSIHCTTSFEMLAQFVAAGYGVGVTAHSRIERTNGWGSRISMRAVADGPFEILTQLLRPYRATNAAAERFEQRALLVAIAVDGERRSKAQTAYLL
ncbi:substrate-binding domain-containing protein [Achromobacter anxifer]|uniref:substrate-binding domain-containing protein n=1 Tax=Achromobacter anxifer TaxID=1287737 RepID=UPI0023F7A6AD|nr:substrate-binding domain-containing protein [Achromobacter anxifer]MDF8361257.1 substrate-binding domain-containing protein [Achromobacter anxifer]